MEVPKSGGHRKFVHPDGRETEVPIHAKALCKGIQATILKQAGLQSWHADQNGKTFGLSSGRERISR